MGLQGRARAVLQLNEPRLANSKGKQAARSREEGVSDRTFELSGITTRTGSPAGLGHSEAGGTTRRIEAGRVLAPSRARQLHPPATNVLVRVTATVTGPLTTAAAGRLLVLAQARTAGRAIYFHQHKLFKTPFLWGRAFATPLCVRPRPRRRQGEERSGPTISDVSGGCQGPRAHTGRLQDLRLLFGMV